MDKTKKRVLLIAANGMDKSGVPSVFMSIVNLLNDEFIFDILITDTNKLYYKKQFLSFGGTIYSISFRHYKKVIVRFIYRIIVMPITIKKTLRHIFKQHSYDIIHSFKEYDSNLFFKIARKYNVNTRILHVNRMFTKKFTPVGIYSNAKRRMSIRLSSHHIAVSNLAGKSFYKNKAFNVVYNTYNENAFTFSKLYPSDLVLLQIGTLIPLKNQLFSLKVFSRLHKQLPNSKLFFVSKQVDNSYYDKCLDYIKKEHIEQNVSFLPFDTSLGELLPKISFVLLPSETEGLPIVAIEAQASGVHVFASSSVTNEVNCGNITFLPLDVLLWENAIKATYYGNDVRKKVDMSAFSNNSFKNSILSFYVS